MKSSIAYALVVQLLSLSTVHAAEKSKYELAVAAIDAGDCKTALPLLKEFKSENEAKLKDYKDFENELNRQIAICTPIRKEDRERWTAHNPQPKIFF